LRFRNEQIIEDVETVLAEIAEHLTAAPQAENRRNETWASADNLTVGAQVVLDESGKLGIIEIIEARFVSETTVYDLTVEEDHSFVTEAGVVQ
jgi:hypothetical protein